jgi:hypothetical protein
VRNNWMTKKLNPIWKPSDIKSMRTPEATHQRLRVSNAAEKRNYMAITTKYNSYIYTKNKPHACVH